MHSTVIQHFRSEQGSEDVLLLLGKCIHAKFFLEDPLEKVLDNVSSRAVSSLESPQGQW